MDHVPRAVTPVLIALAAVAAAACGSSHKPAPAEPPARFTTTVDNPWFPLRPGTRWVYAGVKDGKRQRDVVSVTSQTKTVGGIPCAVVHDRVYSRGRLSERTSDYYSQDSRGNVWYVGEDTAELDAHGKVTSTEGTWHTGVGGAKAGVFMPANPRVGEHHLQEYYRGHAEDQFRVVSLRARVKTPYRDFRSALLTHEWTRLEPRVLDAKYYVRGIGQVFEGSVKGPKETARLVSVARP
jgi:hypothetical protein